MPITCHIYKEDYFEIELFENWKTIFTYHIEYEKVQNLSKIIKIKVNRYAEDYDRSKYLTSITTEEKNKDLLKKYEEI